METRIRTGARRDPMVAWRRHLGDPRGAVLLDSAAGGRWQVTGLPAAALVVEGGRCRLHTDHGVEELGPPDRALPVLLAPDRPRPRGPAPFQEGWMGYLGYGLGHWLDRIPREAEGPEEPPTAVLFWMDAAACLDRRDGRLHLAAGGRRHPRDRPDPEAARRRLDELEERLGSAQCGERRVPDEPGERLDPGEPGDGGARAETDGRGPAPGIPVRLDGARLPPRAPFEAAVARAREHVARGDVFQVNLAQRFELAPPDDALALYRHLRRVNPAPYAGYLAFGATRLLSCSPELLVEVRGRQVEARPIAGTFPRGADPGADRRARQALRAHPKEQAEHVMLVDLERNDLGRVAEYGSVRVEELLGVHAYATVHHLVSTVMGRLRADVGPFEVLRAVFPGGTITGAPKIRATEIVRALEATPRGPYTGSLGFVDRGGDQCWNILIRTLVEHRGRAWVHAGAGIVWDSIPEREYRETIQKAKVFLELAGLDLAGLDLTVDVPGPGWCRSGGTRSRRASP